MFTLEMILTSNTKTTPVMKGKGSSKDCSFRNVQLRSFAWNLASNLRMHVNCTRGAARLQLSIPLSAEKKPCRQKRYSALHLGHLVDSGHRTWSEHLLRSIFL